MSRIVAFPESLYEISDCFLRNHLSVDAYPFAEVYKMRRSIEAYSIALALEDGGKHMGGASFAVGAGYVYALESCVGMSEIFIEVEACL